LRGGAAVEDETAGGHPLVLEHGSQGGERVQVPGSWLRAAYIGFGDRPLPPPPPPSPPLQLKSQGGPQRGVLNSITTYPYCSTGFI
jgi:hypothetical protein